MHNLPNYLIKKRLKKSFFISLLTLCLAATGLSQSNTGLILDEEEYKSIPLVPRGNSKNVSLPPRHSLKKYSPYPKSQGRIASCVGWAVGYGALTISEAQKKSITDKSYLTKTFAYSASFIYNQINSGDCHSGASLKKALEFLKTNGDCSVQDFPNSSLRCNVSPPQKALMAAKNLKLQDSHHKLFESREAQKQKIASTKRHIFSNSPVAIGLSRIPSPTTWVGKASWEPNDSEKGKNKMGHAMVVVGYDDGRQAFELMNSYGSEWGRSGYIWISYEDYARYAVQAFVIEDKTGGKGDDFSSEPLTIPIQMSGGVQIEYLDSKARYVALAPDFDLATGVYSIKKNNWPIRQDFFRFQIDLPMGRHAYLFSIDEEGKAEALSELEAPPEDTLITIPSAGAYNYLGLGNEKLCLLFSYEKIPEFQRLLDKLSYVAADNPMDKINKVFNAFLVPQQKVDYHSDRPYFESLSTSGEGIAAPMVIELLFEE